MNTADLAPDAQPMKPVAVIALLKNILQKKIRERHLVFRAPCYVGSTICCDALKIARQGPEKHEPLEGKPQQKLRNLPLLSDVALTSRQRRPGIASKDL
jgi:hypothetical protein